MTPVPSALAHVRSVSATESPSSVHQQYRGSVSLVCPVQHAQEEQAASGGDKEQRKISVRPLLDHVWWGGVQA